LNSRSYENSYSETGISGSVKGTVNWNNNTYSTITKYPDRIEKDDSAQIAVTEYSYSNHIINPGFKWQDSAFGENLKFGMLVRLPMTITNTTNINPENKIPSWASSTTYTDRWRTQNTTYNDEINSQKNETTITNTHTSGTIDEFSYFSIAPIVRIGASYGLIPNKFIINAGATVYVPGFNSTSMVKSKKGIGSIYSRTEKGSGSNTYVSAETLQVDMPATIEDTVQTVTAWTALSGSLSGGFVFNFNENFMLDMSVGSSNFTYNLTQLTALFTIKFNEKARTP